MLPALLGLAAARSSHPSTSLSCSSLCCGPSMSLGPVSASATGDQKNTSALLDLQLATEPECRLRRGWKRKRPRLGDNNHNTLSFGIQFQLSSKHIFASNAHEKHLNGLTLATTSPKPMHYGKVSLGGVTFRISNFSPTLEENITFTFYFNDFFLKHSL